MMPRAKQAIDDRYKVFFLDLGIIMAIRMEIMLTIPITKKMVLKCPAINI